MNRRAPGVITIRNEFITPRVASVDGALFHRFTVLLWDESRSQREMQIGGGAGAGQCFTVVCRTEPGKTPGASRGAGEPGLLQTLNSFSLFAVGRVHGARDECRWGGECVSPQPELYLPQKSVSLFSARRIPEPCTKERLPPTQPAKKCAGHDHGTQLTLVGLSCCCVVSKTAEDTVLEHDHISQWCVRRTLHEHSSVHSHKFVSSNAIILARDHLS